MVITSPEDHQIVQTNEAFRELIGYHDGEVQGRVADDLQPWEDSAQRKSLEDRTREHRIAKAVDVRLLTKDGQPVDCLLSAARFTIRGEDRVLWLFYQDISARRHSERELVEAIEAVVMDASWFSRSIMDKLATLRGGTPAPSTASAELTPRERHVLGLICEGLDDAGLARELGLSANTVRNHVARLYRKIGVRRRSAAVVWARERGITGR